MHEHRAECLFSFLKPSLRVFRGLSKLNLPGYVGFFQFLRNVRQQNAFEQAELLLQAALDPAIARGARRGEFVHCWDQVDLLQTAINGATNNYSPKNRQLIQSNKKRVRPDRLTR